MSEIKKAIYKITTLEELTHKNTPIHQLAPSVKLIITVIFLITVISCEPNQLSRLFPFLIYPVILMILGDIPVVPLLHRLLIALPFSVLAGLSNLILSRAVVYDLGFIVVTDGMISFGTLILKTILTVMAVLILISTTSMNDLLYTMLQYRVPSILVLQLMMTLRYISVIAEETTVMYHAYLLRAPKQKGIKLMDMGTFLGQLILRSFDRAERIYHAMKCRGFEGKIVFYKKEQVSTRSWITILLVAGILILFRLVNVSELIGRMISSM